ncbi:ABC transporter permease [Aureimonas pseudogalii]|uniref:Peptide/nickel transport system permease protein n=1 Tax=Aureimonas pseudogalii TaxID=1744844 RepID=A0A7W6EAZ1_9HYPH|nr:ABC transporter permease [Aureimonas pseudogalii]MBB3998005.1 peptide/nickel transport system permease protein [Aureimonas pseudogalii]
MSRRLNARLVAGGGLVGLLAAVALLAQVWTPVAPPLRMRLAARFHAPIESGWLGTDQLGRDILSLVMLGAGNSLLVAVLAVSAGALVGCAVGLLAAERPGWADGLAMRCMDVLFAFPPVLSAMMLGAALGTGFASAVTAIAVFIVPVFARVTRAGARRILARDFVAAARSLGVGGAAIARRHVLPNIAGDLAVQASIQLGLAIVTEAGLGFLGLGLPPPAPSWGRMLADSQTYLASAPWLAIVPGCAIALAVLGFQLLGDGLRDAFDPRQSGGRR